MLIKNNTYRAFGLTIDSYMYLPELEQVRIMQDEEVHVKVIAGDLTYVWEEESTTESSFIIKESRILFHMPNVAIFSITNGKEIIISPFEEACEDQIRLFLLGTCMGAILFQRKILPLHGSAIAIDGKAYAIVGDSGAGKSTTASALLKRGYPLISDDVIPITINSNNVPVVTPAYPQQKLWKESLTQFGMESEGLRPIVNRESKFAIPVHHQFEQDVLPLAGIFELVKYDGQKNEIVPINNLKRFLTLFYNTYRNFFIEPSGLMNWHFQMSAKIISKIEFYQIKRPISIFTAHDVAEQILNKVKEVQKV